MTASFSPEPVTPTSAEAADSLRGLARLERAVFGRLAHWVRPWLAGTDSAESLSFFPNDPPAVWRDRRLFYAIALTVILIDQISKWLIEANMPLNSQWEPIAGLAPYFQFTHVANRGTAFGLFSGASWLFAIFAAVVSLAIAYFNYDLPTRSLPLRVALGLTVGGALGNFIDRLRLGHVTDFIDFDLSPILKIRLADWAIFNVADLCVVSGAILLAYLLFTSAPTPRPSPSTP